jgi:hypothetical protein
MATTRAACDAPMSFGMNVCGVVGAVVGATIGAVTSMTIDAVFLAREDVKPAPARDSAVLSIAPTFSVTRNSGSVGCAGAF